MPVTTILDSLKNRKQSGRWGIGTAATYLRQMASQGEDPWILCGMAESEWTQAVKDAEQKLTWCDEDMLVEKSYDADELKRAGRELTPGAVLDFDCVITSSKRDRDGDVLEPSGAEPDPRMPLLLQHTPALNIGKLLEIIDQNGKRVRGRFSIIDSLLGRDAAQLVEFGALRISHGFLPKEYEELKDKSGDWIGWHIKAYEIMETSLVSIPSNTDAVVTAFSRGKLFHPVVKGWAKGCYDDRSEVFPAAVANGQTSPDSEEVSGESKTADGDEASSQTAPESKEMDSQNGECEVCGKSASHYVADMSRIGVKDGCYTIAVSSRHAFCDEHHRPGKMFGMDGNEIEIVHLVEKAGRVLSRANEQHMTEAMQCLADIQAMEDASRAVKALAKEAAGHLQAIVDQMMPDEEEEDDEKTAVIPLSVGDVAAWLSSASKDQVREIKSLASAIQKAAERRELAEALGMPTL